MPRWNRRERPDYRHLKDATPESALANAIRSPMYGDGHDFRLLAGFQARLTAMWVDREVLAIDELVPAHEAQRACDPGFFGFGKPWEGAFLHDVVGNLVGWGLRLEVLAEEGKPDARAFRMIRRDPLFERMGDGSWRRLDAEGIREKSARGAGQREAARIRHAEKIAPKVAELVALMCDKGADVPEVWLTRFPEQLARLDGLVERVADARSTFEQGHRGMHLADQKYWFSMLGTHARTTPWPAGTGPTAPAALPAEDLDALDGL